jgi:hypothetical protein
LEEKGRRRGRRWGKGGGEVKRKRMRRRRRVELGMKEEKRGRGNGRKKIKEKGDCSKTTLTGETRFHCEFVHPWDANR